MISLRFQRLIIIAISLIFLVFSITLILFNIQDNVTFFLTPSEIREKNINQRDNIRIGGLVEINSLLFIKDNKQYQFIITDKKNTIKVNYIGILPDLFKEGSGVVAEGKFKYDILQATRIFAKHDENYIPEEIKKQIKESGNWKKKYK